MKIAKALLLGLLSLSILTSTACGDEEEDNSPNNGAQQQQEAQQKELTALKEKALDTYAKIAFYSYSDSLAKAKKLQEKIKDFTDNPTDVTLQAAKKAWIDSRPEYLQTEVFRFYDGPINAFKQTESDKRYDDGEDVEYYINAWPLDELYLDYGVDDKGKRDTARYAKSLIGGNTTVAQLEDKQFIRRKNGAFAEGQEATLQGKSDDEKEEAKEVNVATGYHAIEFMLWGQDLDPDGPGKRPVTDYTTDPAAEKRKAYLKTVAQILVDDLTWVKDQWDPEHKEQNYLKDFFADPDESFTKVLGGMKQLTLDETGGERVLAALRTGDQEEEHSCFSDNTHVDMIEDVQGILNVWEGYYKGSTPVKQGKGIKDVIEKLDQDLAKKLTEQLNKALDDAKHLVNSNPGQKSFDKLLDKAANPTGYKRLYDFAQAMYATKDTYKKIYTKLKASLPGEEDLDWSGVTQ